MSEERRNLPTTAQLEQELKRLRYQERFAKAVRSTFGSMLVAFAAAVIVSSMLLPVLRVTGTSMTPTLKNDEVLLCSKISSVEKGDIIAFYYNNKVLLKRVIGTAGDVITMSDDGTISINGNVLDEPYVNELSRGECDIEFPYQVPENRIFVMGDHRAVSIDSRSTSVGCIAEENVVGEVFLKIWPLSSIERL